MEPTNHVSRCWLIVLIINILFLNAILFQQNLSCYILNNVENHDKPILTNVPTTPSPKAVILNSTISSISKTVVVQEWYQQQENIQYFVINLPRDTERLQSLESLLQREKVDYRIEEAVDAHADRHQENLNTCPCLPQDSHHGTKALTMSNLNIFKKVLDLENPPEWIGIFEDDAILPLNFNLLIAHSIQKFSKAKVINFDKRTRRNPECCLALVLYHRSILELLVKELDFKKSVYRLNMNVLVSLIGTCLTCCTLRVLISSESPL